MHEYPILLDTKMMINVFITTFRAQAPSTPTKRAQKETEEIKDERKPRTDRSRGGRDQEESVPEGKRSNFHNNSRKQARAAGVREGEARIDTDGVTEENGEKYVGGRRRP